LALIVLSAPGISILTIYDATFGINREKETSGPWGGLNLIVPWFICNALFYDGILSMAVFWSVIVACVILFGSYLAIILYFGIGVFINKK